MPPKQKFSEGEKVLCYHGPLIYEAKCLKFTVTKDKQIKYFVHYAGWSKNWDEWVPEGRVLKFNDVNIARQKDVQKLHTPVKPPKKTTAKGKTKADLNTTKESDSRASTPTLDTSVSERRTVKSKAPSSSGGSTPAHSGIEATPDAPKKKRGKPESVVDIDEEYVSKIDVSITMPAELKTLLVDDWEMIHSHKKLWTLPSSLAVDNILENYITYKQTTGKATTDDCSESSTEEITKGIREYFNATLNTQLLYKSERQQCEDVLAAEGLQPSRIYGGIHLLRLFVKLGANLTYTLMDDSNIHFLVEHLQDFLLYLVKHMSTTFNMQECFLPDD